MRPIRLLPLVLLALLCPAVEAAAQAGPPTDVPVELVRTLLHDWSPHATRGPEILVGRLPEDVSRAVTLPPEARPLGSAVYRAYSMNVVAVPRAAEAAEQLEQRLLEAGWVRAPRMDGRGFETTSPWQGVQLCRADDAEVVIVAVQSGEPGGYLHLRYSTDLRHSLCRRDRMERMRGLWLEAPLPSLRPPPGVPARGGGTSGSSERVESVVFLTTDLTAAELLAHYAAQLRQHGWTAVDEAVSAGIAVQTWRFADEEGKAWHATLLAVELLEGRQREMVLRASELSALR